MHSTDRIIVGTPIKADGTLFGGVQGPPAPWVINGLIVSSCTTYTLVSFFESRTSTRCAALRY
jgi:hypothetical protein